MEVICKHASTWAHVVTSEEEMSRHIKQDGDSTSMPTTEDGADRHEYTTYGDEDDVHGNKDMQQQLELLMQVPECSMCGHVGLPQYLFKCLSCSSRFQHSYCSKLYPYRMEASICNWCLPLKLEITAAEEDDDDYICDSIDSNNDTCDLPIEPDPGRPQSYQQVKQIKKHSKAFEFLLQIIAELADRERCHQLKEVGGNHQTKSAYEVNNDVCHDQISEICRFNEVGCDHISREADNLNVHHMSLSQQNNLIKEDFERKSFSTRTGREAQSLKGALLATTSKRPCSHNDSWQPAKDTDGVFIDHDILTDHKEAISLPAGATASAAKRPKLMKKQSLGDAGGDDCMNDEKGNEQGSILAAAAEMGFGLNYVSAAAGAAVIDDDVEGVDEQGALQSKQMMWVAAMQKPAAGKRDHLINSPSRAFNRRYKLLADVLC